MMSTVLSLLGILLAAAALAVVGYYGARWAVSMSEGYGHLLDYRAAGEDAAPSRTEQRALRLFGRVMSLDEWERRLRWAQRNGRFQGKRLGNFAVQSLGFGLFGFALAVLLSAPITWVLPVMGAAMPWVRLYSAAEDARDRTTRDLPAVAAVVASELAAGTPADEAVRRAAVLPGPLAGLLADAMTFSRETGRPLFADVHSPVRGALVEVFTREGVPQLAVFARQLNAVAVKGVEGAAMMSGVAQSLADEYQAMIERRIEQLDSRIWPVIALFFFFPFVGLILLVNLLPALAAMSGVGGM